MDFYHMRETVAESSYYHPDREVSSFSPDQLGNSQGRTLMGPAGVTCPPPECDQDGNDWLNHATASLLALSSKVGEGGVTSPRIAVSQAATPKFTHNRSFPPKMYMLT